MASHLSDHHQSELGRFLKFFRSRMKTHLENIEADFEDTRSDRLSSDDVYSQKDIKAAVDSLCFAVKANVRSELQDTINMMALLLRQIFAEAEDSKLALELDIGMVEDKALLERVERLTVAEWVSGGSADATAIGALSKPKAVPAKTSPSKEEVELKKQMQREKEQHEEEIRSALHTSQQQHDAQDAAHAKELKKLQRKLEAANGKVEDLEQRLDEAQQHVAQTKQFQALKKMVSTKNDQLQELRRRLRRYEPDADEDDGETKNADDDED